MSTSRDDTIKGAIKWLRRITERKEDLPASFFDGCDPGPTVEAMEHMLAHELALRGISKFGRENPGRGFSCHRMAEEALNQPNVTHPGGKNKQ